MSDNRKKPYIANQGFALLCMFRPTHFDPPSSGAIVETDSLKEVETDSGKLVVV